MIYVVENELSSPSRKNQAYNVKFCGEKKLHERRVGYTYNSQCSKILIFSRQFCMCLVTSSERRSPTTSLYCANLASSHFKAALLQALILPGMQAPQKQRPPIASPN